MPSGSVRLPLLFSPGGHAKAFAALGQTRTLDHSKKCEKYQFWIPNTHRNSAICITDDVCKMSWRQQVENMK